MLGLNSELKKKNKCVVNLYDCETTFSVYDVHGEHAANIYTILVIII